jgi:hypothetical protein
MLHLSTFPSVSKRVDFYLGGQYILQGCLALAEVWLEALLSRSMSVWAKIPRHSTSSEVMVLIPKMRSCWSLRWLPHVLTQTVSDLQGLYGLQSLHSLSTVSPSQADLNQTL